MSYPKFIRVVVCCLPIFSLSSSTDLFALLSCSVIYHALFEVCHCFCLTLVSFSRPSFPSGSTSILRLFFLSQINLKTQFKRTGRFTFFYLFIRFMFSSVFSPHLPVYPPNRPSVRPSIFLIFYPVYFLTGFIACLLYFRVSMSIYISITFLETS